MSVCATEEVGASWLAEPISDMELSSTSLSRDGVGVLGTSALTVGSEGVVEDGEEASVFTSEALRSRKGSDELGAKFHFPHPRSWSSRGAQP